MTDETLQVYKNAVKFYTSRKRPPKAVLIRIDHAIEFDVDYIEDMDDRFKDREPFGEPIPKFVEVTLEALQGAVDAEIVTTG